MQNLIGKTVKHIKNPKLRGIIRAWFAIENHTLLDGRTLSGHFYDVEFRTGRTTTILQAVHESDITLEN